MYIPLCHKTHTHTHTTIHQIIHQRYKDKSVPTFTTHTLHSTVLHVSLANVCKNLFVHLNSTTYRDALFSSSTLLTTGRKKKRKRKQT